MSRGPTHSPVTTDAGRKPADVTPAPAPVAPAPLPAGPAMLVGHAEDRAEADADRRAGAALGRLQRVGPGTHQHGPGCDHVRRTPLAAGGLASTLQPAAPVRRPFGQESEAGEVEAGETEAGETAAGAAAPAHEPTRRKPSGKLNLRPSGMDELLGLSGRNVQVLLGNTAVDGPLMEILRTAFEANWFKAKDCLVFGKWPGDLPAFNDQAGLDLMSAMTELRGQVHQAVMPKAQQGMKAALQKRAAETKANAPLSNALSNEASGPMSEKFGWKGPGGAGAVDYKGSVGADTVTSDTDVSTGGQNSELAVRVYNETFRELLGLPYDPGTVFDLNVYAMDFVHGMSEAKDKKSFTVKQENDTSQSEQSDVDAQDREQQIWSLVHVARYMPDDAEWDAWVKSALGDIKDDQRRTAQADLYAAARKRAKGFEERVQDTMQELYRELEAAAAVLTPQSAWGADDEHFSEGALRMRASNKLYEDKLLQVKDLRARIADLKKKQGTKDANPKLLSELVTKVAGEVSMAQLYANEVYGSGGATVHAVFGMQTKKKLSAKYGHEVEAKLSPQEWFQAFNDNLGDVLKDFEHFGQQHGSHEPDYWYAAFKMGKYVDRMIDVIPNLVKAKMITADDYAELQEWSSHQKLVELAEHHKKEKDGPAKNDPQKLKQHPYFKTMDRGEVMAIKSRALGLGRHVRTMVDDASAAQAAAKAKEQADGADAAAPTPAPSAAPPDGQAQQAALARVAAAAQSAQSGIAKVEDSIPSPTG